MLTGTRSSQPKNSRTRRIGTRAAARKNRDALPIGDLGIIALPSSEEMGRKINDYIVGWRKERNHSHSSHPQLSGYVRDNYLVRTETPRFGSGEGKATIFDTIRGHDIFLLLDVCNYSITYTIFYRPGARDRRDRRKGKTYQCDHALSLREPAAPALRQGIA